MTEAEAKEKWCPFSRALVAMASFEIAKVNVPNIKFDDHCKGSACMAWASPYDPDNGQGWCKLMEKNR